LRRGNVTRVKIDAAQELLDLRRLLAQWSEVWEVLGLEQRLEVTFSGRFRRSLGRCVPAAGEIRLAAFLLTGPPAVLCEALCHEAAHAAVYELYGRGPTPHGEEWRALMRAAGFEPRAKVPASLLPEPVVRRHHRESLWEHRCPICQASRVARRRVPRWRCAVCRAAGLEGELITTRVAGGRG
jgi:predicted SprT family Zn-dependent metalloprotease